MIRQLNKYAQRIKQKQQDEGPRASKRFKRTSRSWLAAPSQHVIIVEVVVIVAEALGSHLVLSKFTTFLKLVINLKSFKVFTKFNEKRALGVFWKFAAASGVARRRSSAP